MARLVPRAFAVLLGLALLVYAADYAVWRVRMIRGTGTATMTVSRVTVAPLKGSKEEYYFDGTDTASCTVSLLPPLTSQGWRTPCWWMQRHLQVLTRY